MVKTYGLTHVAVAVRDVKRASKFYRSVLGAVEVYAHDGFVQLQTPGSRDVLVFEEKPKLAGKAGGRVKEQGEFVAGEPYLFATDPDGYDIEIWFERPTPIDPPTRRR